MGEPPDPNAARRAAILSVAADVFVRYGFKKASMDDLARAAGLSRQGLYLHFPTKEALFKDTVVHIVTTTRAMARAALDDEHLDVQHRLLSAFEGAHGQAIGQSSAEHWNELHSAAAAVAGPIVEQMDEGIILDIARTLRSSGVAARWKAAGVSAKDLAENLYATSVGLKHRVATLADYRDRMRVAIRMVCSPP